MCKKNLSIFCKRKEQELLNTLTNPQTNRQQTVYSLLAVASLFSPLVVSAQQINIYCNDPNVNPLCEYKIPILTTSIVIFCIFIGILQKRISRRVIDTVKAKQAMNKVFNRIIAKGGIALPETEEKERSESEARTQALLNLNDTPINDLLLQAQQSLQNILQSESSGLQFCHILFLVLVILIDITSGILSVYTNNEKMPDIIRQKIDISSRCQNTTAANISFIIYQRDINKACNQIEPNYFSITVRILQAIATIGFAWYLRKPFSFIDKAMNGISNQIIDLQQYVITNNNQNEQLTTPDPTTLANIFTYIKKIQSPKSQSKVLGYVGFNEAHAHP